MANLQTLSVFVTERLTLAAQEIFKAVEVTVTEYQEEISRSRHENELLKRRLLEAGIDFYSEQSLPIIHEDESSVSQPVSEHPWHQQSEEIQVKLELSAAQEDAQRSQPQITLAKEPTSPKPCQQSEQKMEEMFHAQTSESSLDVLIPAGPFMQIKEEPSEPVPDLRSDTFCEPSIATDPCSVIASSHVSGVEDELDSHRLSSVHKAVQPKRWNVALPSQGPALMEALSLIKTVLPSLPEVRLQSLMERLEFIGVSRTEDLSLVTSDDLKGILQPLHQRKLIRAFRAGFSKGFSLSETSGYFQIPWEKFPAELTKAMTEEKRPCPSLRRAMVRVIISDLLALGNKRPRKILHQIAQEIVKKYPKSFSDISVNSTATNGYDFLLQQMKNRVDNSTRRMTKKLKRPADGDAGARKSKHHSRYDCAQQPDLPDTEDESALADKKAELQDSYALKTLPEARIKKLMAETYSMQRSSINRDYKTVIELKNEWPYLFETTYFFDHTERLLGVPVLKKLGEELSKKGKKILNYLVQMKATQFAEDTLKNPLELLSCVGRYLGDSMGVLLIKQQGMIEKKMDPNLRLPITPCVIIFGNECYKMVVDQTVVNDHVSCPLTALSYLFSLFFVLNIQYPKDAALSLDFIQRIVLGISPGHGINVESERRNNYPYSKLLNFLSELCD
ncbi:uncharacterized protein si:ch211-86h15.1 isoform X1 [Hoplias malabaricus]|uniref:uncharacterized protein si:ch211-86h15.1 isoform X1 n=1 Tax=Hoplias malabaricus TaxID=27720 RepID=UPI00346208E2